MSSGYTYAVMLRPRRWACREGSSVEPHRRASSRAVQGLQSFSLSYRTPPCVPEAVLDDGRNTLLKCRGTLKGTRVPLVSGVEQNGSLALVQSRWYVRPEHGAWLYVQGLHPALQLQDAQGLKVKVVRPSPHLAQQ